MQIPEGAGGVMLTLRFCAALRSDGNITSGARFTDKTLCLFCMCKAWCGLLYRDVL